jgi:hypothetical protein
MPSTWAIGTDQTLSVGGRRVYSDHPGNVEAAWKCTEALDQQGCSWISIKSSSR